MSAQVSAAERKRMFEIVGIVVITLLLIALSRLETRLYELSETLTQNQDFITTVVNFGLINFNVILILVLSFLLFRNVARLVVERRRGILGSNLRAKLVGTLVFFALAPTILFFYVSARFIVTSFDEWFSEKVQVTIQQAQEVGAQVYRQDQRRLESLARFALQRINLVIPEGPFIKTDLIFDSKPLVGFESEYGLDTLKVFDSDGAIVWSSRPPGSDEVMEKTDPFVLEALARFLAEPGLYAKSTVTGEGNQDVVKGIAPINHPDTGQLIGAVMTENRFETQILKSIKTIQKSFANLKPGAQLIKLSYMIILTVMSLLIIFSAVWLGFYVARGITRPIQNLAEATREVALGNYAIKLTAKTDDEAGQLVRAFNLMTSDLQSHRAEAEEIREALVRSNEELEQRRKYMEVVLKNITAGVIAIDARGYVTSVNNAAAKLLGIEAIDVTGRRIHVAISKELARDFWSPIEEKLAERGTFRGHVEVTTQGGVLTLIVDAARIVDENKVDVGAVVVFDDSTEELRAQRVAAWREVARRIAHEIKNPVTPIKLSAQRLSRRYASAFSGEDAKVFESCVDTILKQVDSLRDLVNEFSKFARLPESKPRLDDINDVISETVESYRASYPHIAFDTTMLRPIGKFPLDREQMNRVFINIVTNAIAAIDGDKTSPGRIEFRSSVLPRMNTVRIEVIDNGPGIPARVRDRVLEPYFTTKEHGTGLGLAIVNQIISDHGGYLRIGTGEPRGTKVVIELPMGAAGQAS